MKYGNYDAWKLATPWDDEPNYPEIFKAEKHGVYSVNEKDIAIFDDKMESIQYNVIEKEYETREEYIEECLGNFVEDLGLHFSEVIINKY